MNASDLPFSPACEKNKAPILEVLERVLPASGTVLEIGSGTGQHVVHFSARLPLLKWQPSDRRDYLPGLQQRLKMEGGINIYQPILLDVLKEWPAGPFDAVYSANTAHIMSWEAVCAMFTGVARRLSQGGVFCLYGPFNEGGEFTAPSNAAFDQQLRREDSRMGVRDIGALETLASGQQMLLTQRNAMPANNQLLVFIHSGSPVQSAGQ